jgi:NADH:ubiquinone oxidoreductase subunit
MLMVLGISRRKRVGTRWKEGAVEADEERLQETVGVGTRFRLAMCDTSAPQCMDTGAERCHKPAGLRVFRRATVGLFTEIFSWWGGNTWSNRLYTALRGKLVGTDEFGNRYYVQKKGVGPLGVPRRWVIYKNLAEPSQVPPDWHGWLHYTVDTPPTEEKYVSRPWQKPHRMNLTGTEEAYHPHGSLLRGGRRVRAGGDYEPWRPQ